MIKWSMSALRRSISQNTVMNSLDSPRAKSRLRLQAAVSLLHLATVDVYVNAIASKFVALAITIQVMDDMWRRCIELRPSAGYMLPRSRQLLFQIGLAVDPTETSSTIQCYTVSHGARPRRRYKEDGER